MTAMLKASYMRHCKYTAKANSAFHPSGVGKWVPASAGKAKADMVHSVSGCKRDVQLKLWDPLRRCAIPEHIRGVITTRRYTNPRLPLPYTRMITYRTVSCARPSRSSTVSSGTTGVLSLRLPPLHLHTYSTVT